jgi:hypothetical protein
MSLEFLEGLTCKELWLMRMRHVACVIGTAEPTYYARPLDCRCPL